MDSSYNNLGGFGSGEAVTPAPVSSSAGDIVLAPEKKSHKKMIIVLILAVLVIGVVLGAIFLINKNNKNSISKNSELAFNRYTNYLLYGEDSEEKIIGGYDETEPYILYELEDASAKEKKLFFEKATNLLESFESSLDDRTKSNIKNNLETYKENFELTRMIYESPVLNNHEFIDEYIETDGNESDRWIEEKLKIYKDSNYEKVREYGEDGAEYYRLYKQYMDESKVNGCLDDDTMCGGFSNEELEGKMQEVWLTMANLQGEALENTISGCYTLLDTTDEFNDENTRGKE